MNAFQNLSVWRAYVLFSACVSTILTLVRMNYAATGQIEQLQRRPSDTFRIDDSHRKPPRKAEGGNLAPYPAIRSYFALFVHNIDQPFAAHLARYRQTTAENSCIV